jgi:hypothetical protein
MNGRRIVERHHGKKNQRVTVHAVSDFVWMIHSRIATTAQNM